MSSSILPTNCPSCNQLLSISKTGIDLHCKNTLNCPAQIVLRLSYFTSRPIANISGLSEKNIARFVEELGICDIQDLYNLDYEKIAIMDGFGLKSAQNIEESIENSRSQIADYKFLAGLSIDGIGPEIARLIINKIQEKSHLN
jgi:DNA ligase (NAD+)